jgi:hypothetical protein
MTVGNEWRETALLAHLDAHLIDAIAALTLHIVVADLAINLDIQPLAGRAAGGVESLTVEACRRASV